MTVQFDEETGLPFIKIETYWNVNTKILAPISLKIY